MTEVRTELSPLDGSPKLPEKAVIFDIHRLTKTIKPTLSQALQDVRDSIQNIVNQVGISINPNSLTLSPAGALTNSIGFTDRARSEKPETIALFSSGIDDLSSFENLEVFEKILARLLDENEKYVLREVYIHNQRIASIAKDMNQGREQIWRWHDEGLKKLKALKERRQI